MIKPGRLDPDKRIASLFLLPDCDLCCRFCASERGFSTMTFEQGAELLESLRRHRFTGVVLGGGEPFLWPHGLARLAEHAAGLGFTVQVCTNGVALPDGYERLAGIRRFILPLEAMDPALHDRLRCGAPGHQRVVIERLERLVGAGREVTVSTVVTRENAAALGPIGAYLARLRRRGAPLHAWHLYRFLPVGRGGTRHAPSLELSRDEFRAACATAVRAGPDLPVFRRFDMLRSRSVEFFWYEGERLQVGSEVAPAGNLRS